MDGDQREGAGGEVCVREASRRKHRHGRLKPSAAGRRYSRRVGHKTTHRLLNKLWTRTYRNGRGMKGKQILPMELDAQVLVSRATSQVAPGTVRVADEYL